MLDASYLTLYLGNSKKLYKLIWEIPFERELGSISGGGKHRQQQEDRCFLHFGGSSGKRFGELFERQSYSNDCRITCEIT